MTLKKLAELTGYSVSTVSKAFSYAEDVSEQTRNDIFEEAKRQGVFHKYHHEKYEKKIIAIILPELKSYFYSAYAEELQRIIEADNGIVVLSTDGFDSKKRSELIDYYDQYMNVSGMLVVGFPKRDANALHTPVVSLLHTKSENCDCVCVGNEWPIHQAVRHLHELGHERIAYVGEPLTVERKDIFLRAMLSEGLTVSNATCYTSPYRFERAGADGVRWALAQEPRPTALFCAYDYIAFGAVHELNDKGLCVPQDMSVIGVDNVATSEYMGTPLTTLDSHTAEVSRIAYDLLKRKMRGELYRLHQTIEISGELIIRQSTGRPKKDGEC